MRWQSHLQAETQRHEEQGGDDNLFVSGTMLAEVQGMSSVPNSLEGHTQTNSTIAHNRATATMLARPGQGPYPDPVNYSSQHSHSNQAWRATVLEEKNLFTSKWLQSPLRGEVVGEH